MTTREAICTELRKRRYAQSAAMVQEKVGKTTVPFLLRCLALEGNVLERKIRGQLWYGARSDQFLRWHVEYGTGGHRGHQWRVVCFQPSERGACMLAAHFAKNDRDTVYRVVERRERIVRTWNDEKEKEIQSWHDARKTLWQVRKVLRQPPSPMLGSRPAPTSVA